jgi:hypothetical protein
MSIVRVGLAETKNFSEGYDLIFGKKDDKEPKKDDKAEQKPAAEQAQQAAPAK